MLLVVATTLPEGISLTATMLAQLLAPRPVDRYPSPPSHTHPQSYYHAYYSTAREDQGYSV